MASRAHLLWQWMDELGNKIPAATVEVFEPGTTTKISQTIYVDDDPDTSVYPNPFTSDANGIASFYLVDAKRVDLRFSKTGYTTQTIENLDVTHVANRFEFQGAYSAATTYAINDVVTYDGSSWVALRASTAVTPVEGADWSKMAAKGDAGTTDHGLLTGLADDDHTQYLNTTRHDAHDHSTALGTAALADLGDVAATAPTDGQVLTFDTTNGWQPETAAGGSSAFVGAKANRATAQTLTNATNTAIALDGEDYDSDGFHDNVTNNTRLTISAGKAGKYHFTGQLVFNGNSTGFRAVAVYKNGVRIAEHRAVPLSTADSNFIGVAVDVSAIAGDYFELYGYQSSGGNLALSAGTDFNWLACHYLGA